MKTATFAGLALIVLGIISLAYQGITYTAHKKNRIGHRLDPRHGKK